MKTIECKSVSLWDGAGSHNFGFYIDSSVWDEDIEKAHPHCHIRSVVLTVFDSLREQDENSVAKLRRRVWDKLTPQERAVMSWSEDEIKRNE
jgi:hypothetical protein